MGERLDVLLLGKGTVGSELVSQLEALPSGAPLRLIGIADSARLLFDPRGLQLEGWRERLGVAPRYTGPAGLLDAFAGSAAGALVDCTAASGIDKLYREAFLRGVGVVAANKKPFSGPWVDREATFTAARVSGCALRYETTVGAALPIIGPLQDLIRTGDEVRVIEGSFSGTLGYLCSEVMQGKPVSRAVAAARELGFTEPHPRDDLGGTDVARKALILARELGLALELSDVELEPFVPGWLLAEDDPDRFVEGLTAYDDELSDRARRLRGEGKALRYLARIDVLERRLSVGPVWVDADHPAARLRGTESFAAFGTRRYRPYPLQIQGPGAGASVTAAGVLADLFQVAASPHRHRVELGLGSLRISGC
jgi:homoserine dehydrogenase